ncbi:ankyrin repeat domain-containing protein [Humisphaera borealis]|uniref:Ankyrin repeat domain-containing protein n=1 Tax=Humisphaera borealis TaxID=2807512 RepID=A0A7M2WZ24_9BACT|nr:ankyrin repeat domain-containing protein [Humisphaera borealis]QOV90614.1 ankyrin repeat domain-containing protein [Humisphaera borealis]
MPDFIATRRPIRIDRVLRRAAVGALVGCVLACGVVSGATGAERPASLADAAEKADWPRVAKLIETGADVNTGQADGATALHWAVHRDDSATVKLLLTAGANPKAANRYGVTPLSLACVNGSGMIVTALLEAGADPNATLRGGETALMTAARTGRISPLQALLRHKANVDAADRKGQTAIMWAAADGHADAVQLLIKAGADFRRRLDSGFTPFLFAARNGRIEVVRTLLKSGIDANEVIKTEKGAGRAPRDGTSALLLAVENGHFDLATELIAAGADPNDMRSGFTPLHALSWVRKPDRGDDLGGQPPPQGSGRMSSIEFAKFLIAHRADINRPLKNGNPGRGKLNMAGATPLLLASKTAALELMKLLVASGANPQLGNADGATPIMAAAGLGCLAPTEEAGTEPECVAAVEYLLSLGGDINTRDKNLETAMHGAAYKSLPKVVALLARSGAKIDVWNQRNKYGWTPVTIAEGFRPGNFKPSVETLDALHKVMRDAGVTPPPPTPRSEAAKPPQQ